MTAEAAARIGPVPTAWRARGARLAIVLALRDLFLYRNPVLIGIDTKVTGNGIQVGA